MAGDHEVFDVIEFLADKEAAYEFLREYAGLEIAGSIRRFREERGLTQDELAEILGTKQSVVARWEDKDYRAYSLATLQKIGESVDLWPTVAWEPYSAVVDRVLRGRDIGDLEATAFGNTAWQTTWVNWGTALLPVHADHFWRSLSLVRGADVPESEITTPSSPLGELSVREAVTTG